MTKNTRQEKIDSLQCPCCGNSHQCKMSCESSHSFKAFKQALIWLPYMTNEQLAQLSYETWHIAYNRSAEVVEKEVEEALKVFDSNKKNV